MKRIHIVGCSPRSGTTLLAETMTACFDIDLYEKHEASIFQRPTKRGEIYLTKRPQDICVARPALWLNPELFIIFMLRDPRDVICSKHGKDPDRYGVGLNIWHLYSRYGSRLRQHERFITIRYEDLVREPDRVQKMLMDKMPFLVRKYPFSQFHRFASPSQESLTAPEGLRAITADRIGTWKNHLSRVAGQMRLHRFIPLPDLLIQYGYEESTEWLSTLRGVIPDTTPSHWLDKVRRKNIVMRRHDIEGLTKMVFERVGLALNR
jgi:hypothetical protein